MQRLLYQPNWTDILLFSVPKQKRLMGGMGHEDYTSYFGDEVDRTGSIYTGTSKPTTSYHCTATDPTTSYHFSATDPSTNSIYNSLQESTSPLCHYQPNRYLVGDVLTEENLMKDITRGLREIAKTPSEDSGVELGSNYGLFASRDLQKHMHDRKRLRSRVLENDEYLRDNLDIPVATSYSFAECSTGDTGYGTSSTLPISARDVQDYRLQPQSTRHDRLQYQPTSRNDTITTITSTSMASPRDILPSPSLRRATQQHLVYEPENTPHLSKEEFLTAKVHTSDANI